MKRPLIAGIVLATVVSLPVHGWAQAKTNFAGSWTLDQTKSDPVGAQGRGGRGGGRGGGGGVVTALTIEQAANQVTITRGVGDNETAAVYKLDGNESTNTLGDIFLSRSKVSWDGPKLVITTVKSMGQGPNGMMSEDTKEVYGLDGGVLTLIITIRTVTPNGEQTRKLVYNKKS